VWEVSLSKELDVYVRCVAGNVVERSINQSDPGEENRGRCRNVAHGGIHSAARQIAWRRASKLALNVVKLTAL
jgi:hypothetical protein